MLNKANHLDAPTLSAAARWYVDLQADPKCPVTQQAHRQWLNADPRHQLAWARLSRLQDKLECLPPNLVQSTLQGAHIRRRDMLKLLSLTLATGGLGLGAQQSMPWATWMAEQRTRTGERRHLVLADGSQLMLNTATALDVEYRDDRRSIQLYQGEILVETAPDPLGRPFIVLTPQGQIRALGTRFLVRLQDDHYSRVSVLQHAVEVSPKYAAASKVRVNSGQQLRFSEDQWQSIQPLDEQQAAWTQGMLVARNQRLADFIAELSRYRPGQLSCADEVANLRISGSFALQNTDAVLENLTTSLPVQVRYFTRYWARLEAL